MQYILKNLAHFGKFEPHQITNINFTNQDH